MHSRSWTERESERFLKVLIGPKLDHSATVSSPHLRRHIAMVKKVQRRATETAPKVKDLCFREKKLTTDLPTLEEKRKRGDMVTAYKSLNRSEVNDKQFPKIRSEGPKREHSKKLRNKIQKMWRNNSVVSELWTHGTSCEKL